MTDLSLKQTIADLEDKKYSLEELNAEYLSRIEQLNPKLNAFISINEEVDSIPAAIKDAISTKGITTTAGSKILRNYVPVFDATVIKKLKDQGVGVIGKTNMDEFAMGSSGENSAFGAALNPYDLTRVAGGSSSGSAVAVAADMATFALGSDTGGSIRQPAALCGVVGFKPSYGRVSRYGLIAMASSLDQIGTFTKDVADAELILQWIQGADQLDSNAVEEAKYIEGKLKANIKVGVVAEHFGPGLDPEIAKQIKDLISKLSDMGVEIVDIELPHSEYAIATYYVLMASEVSSNLGRFSAIRFGSSRDDFGPEVKRRIMLGTFSLSSGYFDDYFIKAAKVRTLIKQDYDQAFKQVDFIISPVSPTTAWKLGEKVSDPLQMYLSDSYTIPVSLAGLPGISLPIGLSDGLPVGVQIVAPYMADLTLLKFAAMIETNVGFERRKF